MQAKRTGKQDAGVARTASAMRVARTGEHDADVARTDEHDAGVACGELMRRARSERNRSRASRRR